MVWNVTGLWLSIYWECQWMSSSQLTNSYFSEGWRKTTNQECLNVEKHMSGKMPEWASHFSRKIIWYFATYFFGWKHDKDHTPAPDVTRFLVDRSGTGQSYGHCSLKQGVPGYACCLKTLMDLGYRYFGKYPQGEYRHPGFPIWTLSTHGGVLHIYIIILY